MGHKRINSTINGVFRYFIYARKSTDDQQRQVRSIDDQLAELRDLAKRENLDVVQIFIERQTAKRPGRPIFNEMLDRIERGEANGILAWHPDRLSRNSIDTGRIIWLVDTNVITSLRFPTTYFEPNANGKFNLSVMFSQSKYYVDNLSENIKRGQRQRIRNGIWPMVPPVGYLNDYRTRGIVPDPVRGPLIRQAFELYTTGQYTMDGLTQTMNAIGLTNRRDKPLSRAQYHRLLSNPLYCGLIIYGGESSEGKHEPLVTKRLFDRCQEVLKEKAKPWLPTLKPYLYRGMFRCAECGAFVTTETQKGYNYLHCTKRVKRDCSQPFVREEEIARQITEAIHSVCLPEDWIDWMQSELEREQQENIQSLSEQLGFVRAKIAEVDEKLKRLTTAYLDQALSLPEYRDLKQKLTEEKVTLREEVATLEQQQGGWFEPAGMFLKALREATLTVVSANETQKRDFLKKIGSNLYLENKKLRVQFRGAWETLTHYGRFAQLDTAPQSRGAVSVGESDQSVLMRRR